MDWKRREDATIRFSNPAQGITALNSSTPNEKNCTKNQGRTIIHDTEALGGGDRNPVDGVNLGWANRTAPMIAQPVLNRVDERQQQWADCYPHRPPPSLIQGVASA